MSDPADPLAGCDGSVVTPLLTKFRGLTSPAHGQFALVEFEFENGAVIRIPITCDAAASFKDALMAWMSQAGLIGAVLH